MEKFKIIKGNSLNQKLLKKGFFSFNYYVLLYRVDIDYKDNTDSGNYENYLVFTEKWLGNVYFWTKNTDSLCLNILFYTYYLK